MKQSNCTFMHRYLLQRRILATRQPGGRYPTPSAPPQNTTISMITIEKLDDNPMDTSPPAYNDVVK